VNGEQAAIDFDARSWSERRSDEYRASLADRAKTTGQGRAVAADPEGFDRASKAIAELTKAGDEFTADDVRAWSGPFSLPDVIGAAFSAAKKAELIRVAGVTTSKAVSRHGGVVRTWRGVICDQGLTIDSRPRDASGGTSNEP
jgi:hypothetical protein